jgi:hypothetical protein
MNMISEFGQSLSLAPNRRYLVMDALYFTECKKHLATIDFGNLLIELRLKVFPYNDTPCTFLEIDEDGKFQIEWIRNATDLEAEQDSDQFFSVDSGMIIVVAEDIAPEAMQYFDFGMAVDSLTTPINADYWAALLAKFASGTLALVIAPGIGLGFDFQGSGLFCIRR